MADGSYTAVNFGSMATGEADFASTYSQMTGTLQTLESEIQSSLSQWTGAAQQAYYAAKAKWDQASADMATVIQSLSQAVGTANENYTNTERANTSMWSS